VYSRRSGGLSVGVNLFPDKKACPFDCPYCEVFPFLNARVFSAAELKDDLTRTLREARERGAPVRDICLSGNGEPSASPHLEEAMRTAWFARNALAPNADIVVITNGAGLFDEDVFDLLKHAVTRNVRIWLKLDAGTAEWFSLVNKSSIDFDALVARIRAFAQSSPVTIQTMLCSIYGKLPSNAEEAAWTDLALDLALTDNVRLFQLYGKARPAPADPAAAPAPRVYLDKRAASLRAKLSGAGLSTPVEVY
jgi:histidinol dehydrogenase